MSNIDWPPELSRTSAAERTKTSKFSVTIGQTTKEIAAEMDRLDADDWRAATASGGSHVKTSGLPKHSANLEDPGFVLRWSKEGEQFAVACDHYAQLRDNCRAVYLWVRETRLRGDRPVVTAESEFAAARLPAGEDVVAGEPPAHVVLGVEPDATAAEIREAYREAVMEAHPDRGGDEEQFNRVRRAREVLVDE